MEITLIVMLGIGLVCFLSLFIYYYLKVLRLTELFTTREVEHEESRARSLRVQRGAISGDDVAKFLPWAEEYFSLYNSRDVVRVGDIVDYLVFVGKVDGEVREAVFQEVKLGSVSLSKTQSSLRRCIEEGRVRWETWTFDKEENHFRLRKRNTDAGLDKVSGV